MVRPFDVRARSARLEWALVLSMFNKTTVADV
jgi:hypothetical protein